MQNLTILDRIKRHSPCTHACTKCVIAINIHHLHSLFNMSLVTKTYPTTYTDNQTTINHADADPTLILGNTYKQTHSKRILLRYRANSAILLTLRRDSNYATQPFDQIFVNVKASYSK